MGFCALISRHMDGNDKMLFILGVSGSLLFGASLPGFCLFFGGMIDEMGGDSFAGLQEQAKMMLIIGAGVYIFAWF